MRILITGGAGYIGSHTTRLLLRLGHDAWVYDDLSQGRRAAVPADRLIVGALAEGARLDEALGRHDVEAVLHFAARTYVGESIHEPAAYYEHNVLGTWSLLEAMRRQGVQRLVFTSTDAVYGNPARAPIEESDPQQPINPYGRTKLINEQMLADYSRAYGLGYIILRCFNAAGACRDGALGEDHVPETHLIPLALQVALGRRPHVDVFGDAYPTPDGTCVRDYVHVDDLAAGHELALQRLALGRGAAYNLGTGRGHSVREVLQTCREVTGADIPERIAPPRAGDPAELVASPRLALRDLGWQPQVASLRDIVATAWNWRRNQPDGYPD